MQNSLNTLLISGIKIATAFSYIRLLLNLFHDDRTLYLPCDPPVPRSVQREQELCLRRRQQRLSRLPYSPTPGLPLLAFNLKHFCFSSAGFVNTSKSSLISLSLYLVNIRISQKYTCCMLLRIFDKMKPCVTWSDVLTACTSCAERKTNEHYK